MSHLPIWYLGSLSDELCDLVIKDLTSEEAKEASIGIEGKDRNLATRDTKIRFAKPGYWLEDIYRLLVLEANKVCGWDYHITNNEAVQFAEYGVEQHYTWHCDTFVLSGQPTDRKITVVCLLNEDFEGGDFEVRLNSVYKAPLKKGSIIAFPSILDHRVTPVLSGTRYSATAWFSGPRFR
jgi:PKHD-type hydroxylase